MSSAEAVIRVAWQHVAGREHELIIEDVLARHREPHRRYHTAEHVMWVLRHVDDLLEAAPQAAPIGIDAAAIRVAAMFHDVIYDPKSAANEVNSAALAHRAMQTVGWSMARCDHVADMIQDTATHVARSADSAVLLDADLAVLAADQAGYQAYVDGVRAEYSHVAEPAWRHGRAAVLRGLLQRSALFATATGRQCFEPRARTNIAAELAALHDAGDIG
jgi:predicted metal-dependent HD superfamily phosphohydrolase